MTLGGLAGIAATVTMTAAMRRLHPLVDGGKRYPLPPRQIIDRVGLGQNERAARGRTVLAHVAYGALTGAIFAALPRRRGGGVAYGLAVWGASYLGWIPAIRILTPATRHPLQRNLLMTTAHVVWGAVLSRSLSELEHSGADVFGRSPHSNRRREIEMHADDQ